MLLVVLTCAAILDPAPGCRVHVTPLFEARTTQQCFLAAGPVMAARPADYPPRSVQSIGCRRRAS